MVRIQEGGKTGSEKRWWEGWEEEREKEVGRKDRTE